MRLFIDDDRPIPAGWVGARTNAEAIQLLSTQSIDTVSLDYDNLIRDKKGNVVKRMSFKPVAQFILELPEKLRPSNIIIHSANLHGAQELMNMFQGKVKNLDRGLKYLGDR
jgi:hypothetical protein